MIRHLLPALIVLAGCKPYEPPLRPKNDERIRDIPNAMAGSISVIGPTEAPGPAIVLMFDARFPGPPEGIDEPVDFATVAPEEFHWGGEGTTTLTDDTGAPYEAPLDLGWHATWSASEVKDGAYQVEAIVDMDGDFSPAASTLGGATCGDWQGYYERDRGSGVKGEVGVSGGEVLDGVSIMVTDELTTERPAFTFTGDKHYQRMSLGALASQTTGIPYTIRSTGVHAEFTNGDGDPVLLDLADPCSRDPDLDTRCAPDTGCEGAISVLFADKDGDGRVDGHPDFADFGLKDIWPRVYVQYLGEAELVDGEPAVDPETSFPTYTPYVPEEEGVFWATENFTFGQEGVFGLLSAFAPVGVPTKFAEVPVMFPPLVAKFYPAGHSYCLEQGEPEDELCMQLFDLAVPEQAAQVPRGVWSVTLVSKTGQTWAVPNEISEWGVASTAESFDPMRQGGFLLTVD